MPERGVVYIASREPYLSEAARSAESVRDYHPDIPITLFAPAETDPPTVFDTARQIDDPSHDFGDSTLTPAHITHERTLFLDSDTYVTGSLDPVFTLLDRAQLAAAQDPTRTGTAGHEHDHHLPDTFPQYNTGVLAYRDTRTVRDLFESWGDLYRALDGVAYGLNQPAFRIALYESSATLATLPPEYNFRIGNVANSVAYACGPVRILHGRSMHWSLPDLADRINATHERRVVIAKPYPKLVTNDDRTVREGALHGVDRAHWAYRKYGPVAFVKTLAGQVKRQVMG